MLWRDIARIAASTVESGIEARFHPWPCAWQRVWEAGAVSVLTSQNPAYSKPLDVKVVLLIWHFGPRNPGLQMQVQLGA